MFFAFSFVLLGASAGVQFASAQIPGISTGCSTTLQNIVTSQDNQCLNAGALLSLATSSSQTSVISTINSWLTGLCSQPICGNSTVESIVKNIASACADDLKGIGADPNILIATIPAIEAAYPTFREIACLKDGSSLCVTQLLGNFEAALGTLSIANAPTIAQNLAPGLNSSTASLTCSKCVKQAYNVAQRVNPSMITSSNSNTLNATCGPSFIDGQPASGIAQTAFSGNSTSKTNGAVASMGAKVVVSLFALFVGVGQIV